MRQRVQRYSGVFCSFLVIFVLLFCFSATGYAYFELDKTFGIDGIMSTDFGGGDDRAFSCLIDKSNRIVLAGDMDNGYQDTDDFALARYMANGMLDSTVFGTGGLVSTDFAGQDDNAHSCFLDSNGNIIVAGSTEGDGGVVTHNWNFALARYLEDGSLDTTTCTDFNGRGDESHSCVIDSEDKTILVGFAGIGPAEQHFGLVRYNTDLSLDTSFNGSGKVTTDVGMPNNEAWASVIDNQGKIVVVGKIEDGFSSSKCDFALARYNSNGTLDTTFNSTGLVSTDFAGDQDVATAVIVDSDDRIVVAGYATSGDNRDFALARYISNGSLDDTFGTNGKVTTHIAGLGDFAHCCTIDSEGRIIVVGTAENNGSNDLVLARYNSDGALDTTFTEDAKGFLLTDIGYYDSARCCVIDDQGRIVVAGYTGGSTLDYDFVVARYVDSEITVNEYTITASSGEGGSVTPSSQTVAEGGSAVFVITVDEGYGINQVLLDGNTCPYDENTNTITLSNVDAPHGITVSFKAIEDHDDTEESSSNGGGCNISTLPVMGLLVMMPMLFFLRKMK